MAFLRTQQTFICYETYGDPKRPPLILITGISGQLANWPDGLIEAFLSAGFYVIIFDNRDVGLSKYYDELGPANIAAAVSAKQQQTIYKPLYSLSDMANDIVVLMDGLNIVKAHLVGVSMGGMIAQVFAIEHPNRILSLTCVMTTTGDTGLPPAKPEVLRLFFTPRPALPDLESYLQHKLRVYRLYNHPDDYDENKMRSIYSRSYQRAKDYPAGFNRHLLAIVCAEGRGPQLKQIEIPSLIIHGDIDPVFPVAHGEQLASCIAHSHLKIIKNMGHGMPQRIYRDMIHWICELTLN